MCIFLHNLLPQSNNFRNSVSTTVKSTKSLLEKRPDVRFGTFLMENLKYTLEPEAEYIFNYLTVAFTPLVLTAINLITASKNEPE